MTRTANRKELFVYGFFFRFSFGGKILSLKADPLRRGFAYLQGKHYFATSASCAVANSLATVDNRIELLHVGIAIKSAEILRSTAAQTFSRDFSESAQTFPRDFSEYERIRASEHPRPHRHLHGFAPTPISVNALSTSQTGRGREHLRIPILFFLSFFFLRCSRLFIITGFNFPFV